MSAAKNKKRPKGKTVPLSDFLHDEKEAPPGFTTCHVDWADAMENEELDDKYTLDVKKVVLPTAPKSARGLDIDMDRVPTKPPYTAYVGNLSYDATEEDIEKFFRKLKLDVTSVRIPREGGERGRVRGFGYAEFPDRQSLIEALSLHNETLKNRSIRVSLATEHGNEGVGGGERKEERSDRTAGDWRSAPREESFPSRNERSRNGPYDNDSFGGRSGGSDFGRDDRGGDRDSDRRYGDRDRGFGERDRGFGGDRDRGFGGDRDRSFGGDRDRGFGGDRDRGFGGDRDRGFGGDRDRGFGGDWDRGYGGDRGGFDRRESGRDFGSSRYDDRRGGDDFQRRGADDFPRRGGEDFPRRGGEEFSRRGGDDFPRRGGGGGGSEEFSRDRQESARDGPKERPKLQLKPRTLPVEPGSSESASSKIFGGAKPVDTAAREREIEEKLAKVQEPKSFGERSRGVEDERLRRTSGGSGSGKSRQSLESRNNLRNSLSEDEPTQSSKGSSNRQRQSSLSSTGSDNVKEDGDSNRIKKDKDGRQLRSNGALQKATQPPAGDLKERPAIQVETEPSIVYTSANKFSHLLNDDDEVDGSASD